jgi:hypothetical protein
MTRMNPFNNRPEKRTKASITAMRQHNSFLVSLLPRCYQSRKNITEGEFEKGEDNFFSRACVACIVLSEKRAMLT